MKITQNQHLTVNHPKAHNLGLNQPEETLMSEFDKVHLATNFENWKRDRCPELETGDAFEIYTIEQILKAKDPSDEDIASGNIGGGLDGGVDGFFFYIDQKLSKQGATATPPSKKCELIIIQSKYSDSWDENVILKFEKMSQHCFAWGKDLSGVKYLKEELKDLILLFQSQYNEVLKDDPSLSITFHYLTKSVYKPSIHLVAKSEDLKNQVLTSMGHAEVNFKFWGAAELLSAVRDNPPETVKIPTSLSPLMTPDGSGICLVKLSDYAQFITNKATGQINNAFFESNVRDSQGATKINKDIKATVDSSDKKPEFWWLNNGITIIAERFDYGAGHIHVTSPEIVNGLQTSHQIFQSFQDNPEKIDERLILLRIIVISDEQTRIRVIKATNYQNPMQELQVQASDPIHLNIQDALRSRGLFYDRRKGQCRREKRPMTKTASSYSLAQMVIAILLQRPSDARSRTASTIDETYKLIFNETYDKRLYVACFLLHQQVSAFMNKNVPEKDIRSRLRYHVSMLSACELVKTGKPSALQIANLTDSLEVQVGENTFMECLRVARKEYDTNPQDKYSKSMAFQQKLRDYAHNKFPETAIVEQQPKLHP